MPGKDGTGPKGARGNGRRRQQMGTGTGGYCYCPNCSYKSAHVPNEPCNMIKCPKYGTAMIRE